MTSATTGRARPRVLVVEDEAAVVLELRRRLERLGYAVAGVTDTGEEAVHLARQFRPDIVLMDITLRGGMDGVEAAGRIREAQALPVVFVTAHTDAQTLRRAGEARPSGYVIKPFEDRELGTALEIALHSSRMERRLAESERWMAMTLTHLGEGVLTVDPDGLVRFVNPEARKLLGETDQGLLGHKLETVYRTRSEPSVDLDDEQENERETILLCRADGQTLPIEQTVSSIRDEAGRELGTVLVFRDISRRRKAQRALLRSLASLHRTLDETVRALTVASETRDPFTAGHQQRVSRLAYALAVELDFDPEQREAVRVAGLVHDVGKIHVPEEILAKPERLAPFEMGIVRDHSQVGHDILKEIPFPWPVARLVLEHHERHDGSGYPAGLRGEDQLPGSRVLAVADVVEAMTAHRPYRAALSLEQALDEIRQGRGSRYDPDVAEACLRLFTRGGYRF